MFHVLIVGLVISAITVGVGATQGLFNRSYPLFGYEINSLTEEKLHQLLKKAGELEKTHLFDFDNEIGHGVTSVSEKSQCKAFPGRSGWPSRDTWALFDKLLDGTLIETVPIAAPCYLNLGIYNAEKCALVRDSFANPYFQYASWPESHRGTLHAN